MPKRPHAVASPFAIRGELGADGAHFRVHHFAHQLASPFPLLAAVGAKTQPHRDRWSIGGRKTRANSVGYKQICRVALFGN
jgi:hypothetical protein